MLGGSDPSPPISVWGSVELRVPPCRGALGTGGLGESRLTSLVLPQLMSCGLDFTGEVQGLLQILLLLCEAQQGTPQNNTPLESQLCLISWQKQHLKKISSANIN